jgi:hypothetical protein
MACLTVFNSCKKDDAVVTPVVEFDSLWVKTYGAVNSDLATCVQQTSEGGYVVCGYTISAGSGDNDVLVMKFDLSGNLLWSKLFGGAGNDQASCIVQTSDMGYVISGQTNSFGASNFDAFTLKLDANGSRQWAKMYKWSNTEYAASIVQTSDGGYILTGYSDSFGSGAYDVFSLKIDASGSIMWVRCYGGPNNDYGNSIKETTDAGYIVAGYTYSYGTAGDACVMKLYGDGVLNWSRTYGGGDLDAANEIQLSSNGYIVCGSSRSYTASEDALVFNIDNSGNTYWARSFGGSALDVDKANSVKQTPEGGFVLAGSTKRMGSSTSDLFVIKLYGDGVFNWEKIFGGVNDDYASFIGKKSNGGFIISGNTQSFGAGSNDIYLISIDPDGSTCLASLTDNLNGGDPMVSAVNAGTVYLSVDFYNTVVIEPVNSGFSTISNTQCTAMDR